MIDLLFWLFLSALLVALSCSQKMNFVWVRPAMADTCFPLKWNWMCGLQPLRAHVLTRVGRFDSTDRPTKTISRQWVARFF